MRYWLLKSEPHVYSIDTLKSQKVGTWDGVRNYAARNNLKAMQKGDVAFFYHSSTKEVGIAGLVTVVKEAYPDPLQFDTSSQYYDPKSAATHPRWCAVDVRFKKKFKNIIPLSVLKSDRRLSSMPLMQRGSRLSVQEVTKKDFIYILKTYA